MSTAVSAESLRISDALSAFTAWLDRHGETSYDHQSYFAGPLGGGAKALYYRRPKLGTLAVAPMILSEALLPSARRLFWHPQRFPIADAHYAMGYAHLSQASGDDAHYLRAVHFLEVLERTRCPGYERHGWGYPFDWVTRTGVMAAQTPLITTTPYVYEAFAAVHRIDGQQRWLDVMHSIAEHALHDIPEKALAGNAATAGYNPQDREGGVVNAGAYRAFLLMSAAVQFGRDDFRQAAQRNLEYVLQAQQADGSWPYATDGVRDFVDHFHTCFVLKALGKIEALGLPGQARLHDAIDAGVRYYVQHLFDADGLPRPFAKAPRLTVYRHELYDYAECINLGTLLAGRSAELDARRRSAVGDLLARWRKHDGSFRSRRLMFGWDNVPMHRWAQAQLFRSLALLLCSLGSTARSSDANSRPAVDRAAPHAALAAANAAR
jgi:N-acylglucosamine 2-epimerase (GlcNAc 2-epimerase)